MTFGGFRLQPPPRNAARTRQLGLTARLVGSRLIPLYLIILPNLVKPRLNLANVKFCQQVSSSVQPFAMHFSIGTSLRLFEKCLVEAFLSL